ncbi:unnamed protein product, partial [Meganyctiphanes norvegica]
MTSLGKTVHTNGSKSVKKTHKKPNKGKNSQREEGLNRTYNQPLRSTLLEGYSMKLWPLATTNHGQPLAASDILAGPIVQHGSAKDWNPLFYPQDINTLPKYFFLLVEQLNFSRDAKNKQKIGTIQVLQRMQLLKKLASNAKVANDTSIFIFPDRDRLNLKGCSYICLAHINSSFTILVTDYIGAGRLAVFRKNCDQTGILDNRLYILQPGIKIICELKHCYTGYIDIYFSHIIQWRPTNKIGYKMSTTLHRLCPDGVDVVLDCLGGDECNKAYYLLKPCGRYILFGSSSIVTGETKSIFSVAKSWWQVDKVSPLKLYDDNRGIIGFNFRRLLHHQAGGAERVRTVVERVYRLWQEGVVRAHIDSTHALEDVAEAMAKMHERRNIGKLILDLSMEPEPPKPSTPAKAKKDQAKEKETEKKEDDKKDEKD